MGSIVDNYAVMQQDDWAGRRFITARDRRTDQVLYLMAEAVGGPLEPYRHPTLPALEVLGQEGDVRWLAGSLPGGETLEDLRPSLQENEVVSALLSVVDALASLSGLEPQPVPSYLDPACIRRDQQGRWVLDYLALAHATEARSLSQPPLGVYPFGVLLYWLITGETVRLSKVQIQRVGSGLPSGLQFILIRCLGRSYPSLAELRADLVRAGNEHEFRHVVGQASRRAPASPAAPTTPVREATPAQPATQPAGIERHRVPLGGPTIPMNDRPWALPERPPEGFRKYVVPKGPDPRKIRRTRLGLVSAAGFVAVLVVGAVGIRSGLVPDQLLPVFLRREKPVVRMPELGHSGAEVGKELPPPPPPPTPIPMPEPVPVAVEEPPPAQPPAVEPPPKAEPANPAPKQPAQPSRPVVPPRQGPPASPQPAPQPSRPGRPELQPGSVDYQDASDGGLPVLVHVNDQAVGWAYIIPHPTSPFVSLPTFNRLFGRSLLWVPHDSTSVRLFDSQASVVTANYTLVKGRLWLRLTPPVQYALGVQVNAYTDKGMSFTTQP
ncbi:MAG TPA: hypothetical protein VK464_00675 [Symbiobacteriaceae bacterium]|nr:hypothetical protein [Symbiobacteriaceae bacterium]